MPQDHGTMIPYVVNLCLTFHTILKSPMESIPRPVSFSKLAGVPTLALLSARHVGGLKGCVRQMKSGGRANFRVMLVC